MERAWAQEHGRARTGRSTVIYGGWRVCDVVVGRRVLFCDRVKAVFFTRCTSITGTGRTVRRAMTLHVMAASVGVPVTDLTHRAADGGRLKMCTSCHRCNTAPRLHRDRAKSRSGVRRIRCSP
jgi:hypothetical protein